ncbi:hypothetical protein [Enterococcus innesii]|nr:hypothetical protein [Enterococcus innesii]
MQDKRKIRIIMGASIFLLVAIVVGLVYMTIAFMNTDSQSVQPPTQTQETSDRQDTLATTEGMLTEETASSETLQTQDSTESSVEKTESVDLLRNFFGVYFTWDLDEKSVSDRADLLKDLMSEELYEQKRIEADSEIIKELINTYQETKEINTSNSTQLVSSRYLSSQIYQDTADKNLYKVTVRIEQKAPYQDSPFMTEESFLVRYLGDQITEMNEVNDQARSDSSGSE